MRWLVGSPETMHPFRGAFETLAGAEAVVNGHFHTISAGNRTLQSDKSARRKARRG